MTKPGLPAYSCLTLNEGGGRTSTPVTRPAPDFTTNAVMPDNSFAKISLSSYQGRTVVLFFYPLDFTFVCPAEIIAFDKTIEEFASRQCQVIGLSVDSVYARLAWRNTPRSAGGTALRGLFLIDRKGIVRHELVNDQGLGRNVDEALQVTETHGEVCPANWRSGEAGVQPTTQGVAA